MTTLNEAVALRSRDDVERFVRDRGMEFLESALIDPNFGDTNLRVATAWLNQIREKKADADAERALVATEISAKAAQDSATAAITSVAWAKAAFAVSVGALLVSFFKT